MAIIDNRGLVDDGSNSLTVQGTITTLSSFTASAGAFGEMTTYNNNAFGQTLGAPNTYVQITQWLTSSLSSPGVSVLPSASNGQTNNYLQNNVAGLFFHSIAMSFSGSAGIYMFAVFVSGSEEPDSVIQQTITSGQPFPQSIAMHYIDFHTQIGLQHDVRVKCNNAGANFQLNYGNFTAVRVVG